MSIWHVMIRLIGKYCTRLFVVVITVDLSLMCLCNTFLNSKEEGRGWWYTCTCNWLRFLFNLGNYRYWSFTYTTSVIFL